MISVAVSSFRAHLVEYLNKVQRGESVVITSHGRDLARLVPPENNREKARNRLKQLRKKAVVKDVISPIPIEWDLNQ